MKRKIIVAVIMALLTVNLMGCGKDISTNKSVDDNVYNEILSKIATSIDTGEEVDTGEFSYMYPRFGGMGTSDFGYAYIQIAENEQALIVGENGSEKYPSILYDMYEVKDGELVHVFSGGERDRYYATDTRGVFIEEGSSSAVESFSESFLVEDGERVSTEFYVEPVKINIVLTTFANWNSSEMTNIEEHRIEVVDDRGVIKKCPKTAKVGTEVSIKTNSFMDVIPQISVNGNDIGEWDKNKTEYIFVMPDEDVKITTNLKNSGLF